MQRHVEDWRPAKLAPGDRGPWNLAWDVTTIQKIWGPQHSDVDMFTFQLDVLV